MITDSSLRASHEIFADRMLNIPRSFIREILKVATAPDMISFAGGLPNRDLFPVEALRTACDRVFTLYGPDVLQYSNSEGLADLRAVIADHYKARGIQNVSPDNIVITSGSQQALDILGKILINKGDRVILEEPSYLGAIQALSIYQPDFVPVALTMGGLDTDHLRAALSTPAKMLYLIPTFQNPSGISYTDENRRTVAEQVARTKAYLIEDDPYGELRFSGKAGVSFMNLIPERTILLGTFSKTVVPAFRLGWVVLPPDLMDTFIVAKQATDLHTNSFAQRVMHQYLTTNDSTAHVAKIVARYCAQKTAMMDAVVQYFPSSFTTTNPEGGMFLWATLPNGLSAMEFFEKTVERKVCVVPGHPFYIGKDDVSTLRLSFSCVDEATIQKGIKILGEVAKEMIR